MKQGASDSKFNDGMTSVIAHKHLLSVLACVHTRGTAIGLLGLKDSTLSLKEPKRARCAR
jgi:hypothetical protein